MIISIYFISGESKMFVADEISCGSGILRLLHQASVIAEFQLANIAGWAKRMEIQGEQLNGKIRYKD